MNISTKLACILGFVAVPAFVLAQEPVQRPDFGARFDDMTPTQQGFIADWVARFNEVTGQDVEAGPFYDRFVRLSTKTTFDAITHALMTSPLTDESGESLGSAIDLIERVEDVRGKVKGARGDHQFRIYVVLKPDALERLEKSREFRRGPDNTVYHKGYPINYRQDGTVPSIQVSIARDGRRADVDVDYRSSSFPIALFNGHLSSSNSDVRAGDNYDRHTDRWAGFRNWWRGLFGIRFTSNYEDVARDDSLLFPEAPRAGKQTIEKMTYDFLDAWLLEGNVMEALAYVSERAYACLELQQDRPLDRGMAPFQLLMGMKAVKDVLEEHESLEGLTIGVRLTTPGLKIVRQPHHQQFALYSVPDDIAQSFDCANRTTLATRAPSRFNRVYGNYFGAVFYITGPAGKGATVALLWAKENEYWKIVSYEVEPEGEEDTSQLSEEPEVVLSRVDEDPSFSAAVEEFLESWLIDKDYDGAITFLSPQCYSCYNYLRGPDRPVAQSDEEAVRYIREGMTSVGDAIGQPGSLGDILIGFQPVHPMVRIMSHENESAYTLVSAPNGVRENADCSKRTRGEPISGEMEGEYGEVNGVMFRFRTVAGETPVFRLVWVREGGVWRVVAYDIEEP